MKFFNDLSIKSKIISIAVVAVIGFSISFVVNFSVTSTNAENLAQLENVIYPILEHSEKNKVRLDQVISLLDQAVAVEEEDMIEEADVVVASMQKSFNAIASIDSAKQQQAKMLDEQLAAYYALAKSMTASMLDGTLKSEHIASRAQAMQAKLKLFKNNLNGLQQESKTAFADVIAAANKTAIFSLQIAAIIGLIITIVLLGTAYLVANGITRNIKNVSDNLQEIASGDGDLTQRLHAQNNDEVGQLVEYFNTFMDKLQTMMQEITGYSSHVGSAAEELTSIAEQSSKGIQSQHSAAEQVATASSEMAATVVEVARNALQTSTQTRYLTAHIL